MSGTVEAAVEAEMLRRLAREVEAERDRLRGVFDVTRADAARLRAELEEVYWALAEGGLTEGTAAERVRRLRDERESLRAEAARLRAAANASAEELARVQGAARW